MFLRRWLRAKLLALGARKNAGQGMAYLDREHPGWQYMLPEDLNICHANGCVVHHLTGELYSDAVRMLGITDPASLGFYVPGDQHDPDVIAEYAFLTLEFRAGRDNRLRATKQTLTFHKDAPAAVPEEAHEVEAVLA